MVLIIQTTLLLDMTLFASVHVFVSNKTIVPWSAISLDPSQNFVELFQAVQAGKYEIVKTSTNLAAAVPESASSQQANSRFPMHLFAGQRRTSFK